MPPPKNRTRKSEPSGNKELVKGTGLLRKEVIMDYSFCYYDMNYIPFGGCLKRPRFASGMKFYFLFSISIKNGFAIL
jgi:hypothetical protein